MRQDSSLSSFIRSCLNVVTKGGEDPAKEPWSVDYGRVTPLLTKAIQEQQVEIESLKADNLRLKADANKLSEVEAENARLKGQTDKLAAKMEALEKTMAAMQTKHGRASHAVVLNN